MSAVVRLQRDDLQGVFETLNDLEQALVDLRPAWRELRTKWQRRSSRQWHTNRWPRLSERYAKQVGRSQATLDTRIGRAPAGLKHPPGTLKQMVTKPAVFEADARSLVMGVRFDVGRTPAFYGAFHQGGRGVPKRPFWRRLTPNERRDWMQVVTDKILEPLR